MNNTADSKPEVVIENIHELDGSELWIVIVKYEGWCIKVNIFFLIDTLALLKSLLRFLYWIIHVIWKSN